MKVYIYSIHDRLIGYNDPLVAPSDDVATRSFEAGCMDKHSAFRMHPTDYTVCLIGSFDSKTGEITPIDPTPIARATDFVMTRGIDNEDE